jgi:hypothetical protein
VAHFGVAALAFVVPLLCWFDLIARLRVAESMTGALLSCPKILPLLFFQKIRFVSFTLHLVPLHLSFS